MVKTVYHELMLATIDLSDPAVALEIGKVVRSKALEGAPSLRRLLEYLAARTLAGEGDSLKEYSVGVDAFHKSATYDPRSDASVRVQASKLREKLQIYYSTEGREDPLIVDLPKGHFKLEFRQRIAEADASPVPAQPDMWRWRAYVLASLLMVAVVACGYLWIARPLAAPARYPWSADLAAIWSPFLNTNRQAVLSLGTPMFLRYADGFYRNSRLNDPSQLNEDAEGSSLPKYIAKPISPFFDYTGIGEAIGAVSVSGLLTERGANLRLQPSSTLSWEDIRRNDLIFIGAPKFNVHLRDLPVKQDFVFEGSDIRNVRPVGNEAAKFVDGDLEGYGVISRLPGLQSGSTTMILAANSTETGRALAEYLTDPKYAAQLVTQLKRGRPGVPKYFQVVVWGRFKSQVPVEIRYVTHHVLNPE
jgi:hypothetical protein